MHGPSFEGEGVVTTLAGQYVKRRKFKDIVEFSRQFGEAGFGDPRITSKMLAEQLERTLRVPHSEIVGAHFVFHPAGLHPHVVVEFALAAEAPPIEFLMRYGLPKVREAHAALAMVLGWRVAALSPP